ncbi:MAG TPA: nuclear transport factor 2 family protein [Azospirillum sp.]|nr:nuclear transport factor 2 family protein [Azospirillum sp.]
MTDADTVLALNQSFYRAFASLDYTAMDALWAQQLPVACLHPGWTLLLGREAVMESWRALLAGPQPQSVHPRNEQVLMLGDTALVLCEEVLPGTVCAASNLFAREDGAWRLVHHQSGPLAPAAERPPPSSRRLH